MPRSPEIKFRVSPEEWDQFDDRRHDQRLTWQSLGLGLFRAWRDHFPAADFGAKVAREILSLEPKARLPRNSDSFGEGISGEAANEGSDTLATSGSQCHDLDTTDLPPEAIEDIQTFADMIRDGKSDLLPPVRGILGSWRLERERERKASQEETRPGDVDRREGTERRRRTG